MRVLTQLGRAEEILRLLDDVALPAYVREAVKAYYHDFEETPPDTQPAPELPPEPVTKPDTPIPIRRASGEHRLDLPHGLASVTRDILAEGKEPTK